MTAPGADPAWLAVGVSAVATLMFVVTAVVTKAPWAVITAAIGVALVTGATAWTLASNPARRLGVRGGEDRSL